VEFCVPGSPHRSKSAGAQTGQKLESADFPNGCGGFGDLVAIYKAEITATALTIHDLKGCFGDELDRIAAMWAADMEPSGLLILALWIGLRAGRPICSQLGYVVLGNLHEQRLQLDAQIWVGFFQRPSKIGFAARTKMFGSQSENFS